MAIWKITCPDCDHCEEVRIDIDDFPDKEQKEFLDKFREREDKSMNEVHIHKTCWKCGKQFNSSKETFEHIEKEHITKK